MTHDEIKAQIPGISIRTGDTGEYLWLTYETTAPNGQHVSWSRRAPLEPTELEISIFKQDLEDWKAGLAWPTT